MYGPGQIIYDLDKRRPHKMGDVWDAKSYPRRHTHFIKAPRQDVHAGRAPGGLFYDVFEIALPKTLKEARELLRRGLISPAPIDLRGTNAESAG